MRIFLIILKCEFNYGEELIILLSLICKELLLWIR